MISLQDEEKEEEEEEEKQVKRKNGRKEERKKGRKEERKKKQEIRRNGRRLSIDVGDAAGAGVATSNKSSANLHLTSVAKYFSLNFIRHYNPIEFQWIEIHLFSVQRCQM